MAVVRSDERAPLQVLDDTVRVLQRSADSPNRMSVMNVEVPPGSGVPPHSHAIEEEAYFVLDGTLELTVGGATFLLHPGDYANVPPGAVHGYRNPGTATTRFLAWTVGGAIDEFFEAMSRSVRRMPDDAPVMQALMDSFGVRAVGAPTYTIPYPLSPLPCAAASPSTRPTRP
jgi:quercetin dioxygenase-like cupin family protein